MKLPVLQLCISTVIAFIYFQASAADDGATKLNQTENDPYASVSAADAVVRSYYAEREHLISASLSRPDQGKDFASQLVKERQLLEELRQPSHYRARLLLVLHAKSQSIATVSETIANEQVKRDPLAAYLVASYKKRLEQLRLEAAILEGALR